MKTGISLNTTNHYISSNFVTDHENIVIQKHLFPLTANNVNIGTENTPFNDLHLSGNLHCDGEFIGSGKQIEDVVLSTGVLKTSTSQTLCNISNIKYTPSVIANSTFFKVFNVSIFSNTNVVVFSAIVYRIYEVLDPISSPNIKTTHDVDYHLINSYYDTNTITSNSDSITFNGNVVSFDTTNNDPSLESISVSLQNNFTISIVSV